MGKKTPPFVNCPDMTTAKFWGRIRSDFRKRWMMFPERKKALISARVGRLINEDTGHLAIHVKCAECGNFFIEKKTEVDHIYDAGKLNCFDDLPAFVDRLFCKAEDLRVLCKKCHAEKTKAERAKK